MLRAFRPPSRARTARRFYTALSYNGSTYMPLRTVGRWMGKNISWDGASRTVFLSGTTEKSYPCADDDAYHKEGVKYVGATGHATLDKGVKVLVDGKQQIFKNQKGVTIYPLFYQNSIYLPLRNIGELTGMDVTWYSAKAENDVNAIFLRMPLSDSKRAEMEAYATKPHEAAARYANGYAKVRELRICGEKRQLYRLCDYR